MLSKIDVNDLRKKISEYLGTQSVYVCRSYDPEMISVWCENFKFVIVFDHCENHFNVSAKITETFIVSKPVETETIKVRFKNIADNMNEIYYLILSYLTNILNNCSEKTNS